MKTGLCAACLAVVCAVPSWGGTTTYSDNFNDGVRNKSRWKIDSHNGGRLVETGGRLYGFSGTRHLTEDYHLATWHMKPALTLANPDVLVVQAVVRMPKLPIQPGSGGHYGMRLGFAIPNSNPQRSCFLFFNQIESGRHFTLIVFKPDSTSIGWGVAPPGDLAKYQIRLKYETATSKLKFYSRANPNVAWTRLITINLSEEWNLWPGSPVTVQPFLTAETYKTRIDKPGPVYFDNFWAAHIRP